VAGAGAGADGGDAAAATRFLVIAAAVGFAYAGSGLGSEAGARSSAMVVLRSAAGMRLTRRSRRALRLAHWAASMALSFSMRARTVAVSKGSDGSMRSSYSLSISMSFMTTSLCS
jgi:hypothetical protein